MKKFILIISMIAFPFVGYADWGWQHDRSNHRFWSEVSKRLDRQYFRIEQGVRKGYLTHWEAKKLKREHRRIDERIGHLKRRHLITHEQKRRILSSLDKASEHIHRLKNNDRYSHHSHDWARSSYGGERSIVWSDDRNRAGYRKRH